MSTKLLARYLLCRTCVLLVMCVNCLSFSTKRCAAEDNDLFAKRQETWRAKLDGLHYDYPQDDVGMLVTIGRYGGEAELHIVVDPKHADSIVYKLIQNDRTKIILHGHEDSSLVTFQNYLYFADFRQVTDGCAVESYDMTTGKREWTTKLHQKQPAGYSAYRNRVTIWINQKVDDDDEPEGSAILVMGSESYCDYIEVLDRLTGKSLAIKNYRVGFGKAEQPGTAQTEKLSKPK